MKANLFIKYLILSIIISSSLFSCNNDEPSDTEHVCNRTILVYMVATNSLGAKNEDTKDINEMIEASINNTFNNGRLLIFHSSYNGKPALKEIKNGKIQIIKEYDQSLLSVDQERMQQVINDTKALAPAKEYGLILWSHANGWLQTGINSSKNIPQKKEPLAFGEEYNKNMNITTLANVINDENFSFIYFDCCNMASIEVVYEIRHSTPYIIASTTEVPGDGMPYEQNIPLFFSNPIKLQDACINTFNYYNCQEGQMRTCSISLIQTKYLDELAQATISIYCNYNTLPDDFNPQKFVLDNTCYFFDFKQYIKELTPSYDNRLNTWLNVIDKVVIYKAATPKLWDKLDLAHHCGLSTFILDDITKSTTKGYNQLQWYNDVASKLFNNNKNK